MSSCCQTPPTSTWACFDCRRAFKRFEGYALSVSDREQPKCVECTNPLKYLGNNVKIPRRTNNSGWQQLAILKFEAKRSFRQGCGGDHSKHQVTSVGEAKQEVVNRQRQQLPPPFTLERIQWDRLMKKYRYNHPYYVYS